MGVQCAIMKLIICDQLIDSSHLVGHLNFLSKAKMINKFVIYYSNHMLLCIIIVNCYFQYNMMTELIEL